MIKKLIKKTKFNIQSSIKHGTVAALTLILSWIFFGSENIMIAFPIALTSVVMGKQNIKVKPFSKYMSLMAIDISIVLISYLANLNIYFGIIINFTALFLITYILVSPYEMTTYRPFLMLYVFTQFSSIPSSELPERIGCVAMGVTFVVIANLVKGNDDRTILEGSIKNTFQLLRDYAEAMSEGTVHFEYIEQCIDGLNKLTYRIYISRHKNFLTTELGRLQFEFMITAEQLAFMLSEIDYFEKDQWKAVGDILNSFYEFGDGSSSYYDINERINVNIETINHCDEELADNIKSLAEVFRSIENIGRNSINEIYGEWERTSLDRPNVLFLEYFHRSSLRFKFAVRMSSTLTAAMFLGEILGYYKIIWTIVTILSVMYHYYEDTLVRIKDRLAGNVIAIMFTGLVINAAGSKQLTIAILAVSLFLIYGFKEYYKISLFSAIASLCIASLTKNVNVIIIYRIIYVLIGGIIVYLANRFIYPYHTVDGLKDITGKILRYNMKLIDDTEQYEDGKREEHEIRDLTIHCILLGEKLHLRNSQYGDENIEAFIKHNNKFVVSLAYKALLRK